MTKSIIVVVYVVMWELMGESGGVVGTQMCLLAVEDLVFRKQLFYDR